MERVALMAMLFITLFAVSCKQQPPLVAIQPLGNIPQEQIDWVRLALDSVYDVKVVLLPHTKPYQNAFTNLKGPRYRADTTIAILKREKPDSIDYVMGLMANDICITKYAADRSIKKPEYKYTDFGIFGLGYRPGPSCVVSTHRLGDFRTNQTKSRLAKVCVHEPGHNFGLPHCPNKKCVMTDAVESIATIDNAEMRLCNVCKSKLH